MEAEQYADLFARCAVTGQRDELTKLASAFGKSAALDMASLQAALANPAVRNALIGAGAGGLLGLVQPKRKGINALQLALMGGLGGLGATYAFPGVFGNASKPGAGGAGAGEGAGEGAGATDSAAAPTENPTAKMTPEQRAAIEIPNEGSLGYSAAGGAGGLLAARGAKKLIDARLAEPGTRSPGKQLFHEYAQGKGQYAKPLGAAMDAFGPGPDELKRWNQGVADMTARATPAGGRPTPSLDRQRLATDAQKVLAQGKLAPFWRPGLRRQQVETLAKTMQAQTGKVVDPVRLAEQFKNTRIARGPRKGMAALMNAALHIGLPVAGVSLGGKLNDAVTRNNRDTLAEQYRQQAAAAAAAQQPAAPKPQVPAP